MNLSRTALQASSRTFYAFSRDHGFPDKGFFGKISKVTKTPLNAVWLNVFLSILPGLLDLASPVAAGAIFALTAVALDISYIIPIACRRIFRNHPDVVFTPGPFYMGDGLLGWAVNINCILYVEQTFSPSFSRLVVLWYLILTLHIKMGIICGYYPLLANCQAHYAAQLQLRERHHHCRYPSFLVGILVVRTILSLSHIVLRSVSGTSWEAADTTEDGF